MKTERDISNHMHESIDNIYKNAFLVAVARKMDLASIVLFVENKMKETFAEDGVDQKFSGLLFVEMLATEMKVPIGDIVNNDIEYQRELVNTIIATISMDGIILDIDSGEEEGEEPYITYALSGLTGIRKSDSSQGNKEGGNADIDEAEQNEYIIELSKNNDMYAMSILTNNISTSDFFKGHIEVWREDEGLLEEFFEEAFEDNLSLAFKEGISEEELVACVFEDTRTLNLMDRFEGYGEQFDRSYQRLVIKNGMIFCNYGDPYIHLVVERRIDNNITGDITLTDFKKGKIALLRQHVNEELDQSIIDNYCDREEFYRFKTGFLLRAQYTHNRENYGSNWYWKKGVGTYVKGTEYGETTDYVFIGAYISTSFLFDPANRKPMMQLCENDSVKCEPDVDERENVSINEKKNMPVQGVEIKNTNDVDSLEEKYSDEDSKQHIYDVEALKSSGGKVAVGMRVRYKKLHVNEEVEEVIGDVKLVHKKLLGKSPGDIVFDGGRQYLIIDITQA